MRETSHKLLPESVAPDLRCETADGRGWDLDALRSCRLVAVVFYRGRHCPLCKEQLQGLNKLAPRFQESGVDLIVLSGDSRESARACQEEWKLDRLQIGCSLQESQMSAWGLYLSDGMGEGEPTLFCEPAVFVIEPAEKKIKYVALLSGPQGRPSPESLLAIVTCLQDARAPARGARPAPLQTKEP